MQVCCLLMYHPVSGDTIIYSLVAYPMGAGHTRTAPGKQTEKDGGKTEVGKRCGYLPLCYATVEFLFHCFPVENTENDCAKNWKGYAFSRLTEGDTNDSLPIWHSCI